MPALDSSDIETHPIHGFFGPYESTPKRYLDRFSRFAGLKDVTNRQTDRPTDHATPYVEIARNFCNACDAA